MSAVSGSTLRKPASPRRRAVSRKRAWTVVAAVKAYSHEKLDIAERRVEIDEIDALELDLEAIADLDKIVRRPPRKALQHVAARLGVDVGRARLEHPGDRVAR